MTFDLLLHFMIGIVSATVTGFFFSWRAKKARAQYVYLIESGWHPTLINGDIVWSI